MQVLRWNMLFQDFLTSQKVGTKILKFETKIKQHKIDVSP